MAPEPLHLVNITKTCPRCNSEDVKFSFFNNYKLSQPRYKCKGCGQLFTYGGKCRAPRVAQPPLTSTTSTAVVAEDRRTGPDQRGGPRHSQRVTPATREIQETPATCARTEERTASICARTRARAVPTCARTEALTGTAAPVVRLSVGALRLPRIPISEQRESPVQSPVVSSVESPAVRGPDPTARRIAGLVPGDVVDVAQRTASRTAATVMAQGDMKQNWTKAVLGVSPFRLVAARNGKQMKVLRVKYDGKETLIPFWATDS